MLCLASYFCVRRGVFLSNILAVRPFIACDCHRWVWMKNNKINVSGKENYGTTSSRLLGNAGEHVLLPYRCKWLEPLLKLCTWIRESTFSSGVNKGNLGGYERRNWIEQYSKQDSYLIQGFYHQLLRYSQPANGEERREGRNGCIRKQRYNENGNAQPDKTTLNLKCITVMTARSLIIQSVVQSVLNGQNRRDALEYNEKD